MPQYDDADEQDLDFLVRSDEDDDESSVDELSDFAPAQSEDAGNEIDAVLDAAEDPTPAAYNDDPFGLLSTVTNPPGTVEVTAFLDGTIHQIVLSPKVARMTESALANEVLVIADLARQQGLAQQRALIDDTMAQAMDAMKEPDLDAPELIDNAVNFPTPQQADAAQAELFSTRYANSD
jgi:hypothetical protein